VYNVISNEGLRSSGDEQTDMADLSLRRPCLDVEQIRMRSIGAF